VNNDRAEGCRICGEIGAHPRYVVREMMFGSREEFEYFECGRCGCLQISEIPADLSPYYRPDYLSFTPPPRTSALRSYLKRSRTRHLFGRSNPLGALLLRVFGAPRFAGWVRTAGGTLDTPILDVGCGAGHLLRQMREAGFTNLTGIDPFLPDNLETAEGLSLRKCGLEECTGTFDLIMLHHSFEHMPAPAAALDEVRRLLRPGGFALIRIPLAGSLAWRNYGPDWVQLDAPRHLHLHTVRSMRELAARAGFEVARVEFDSSAFQFWGSEQYRRGVPLFAANSYAVAPDRAGFSAAEIRAFEARAEALNQSGEADSGCFYLRRIR
jgi:SAM-dependent methyltransferase